MEDNHPQYSTVQKENVSSNPPYTYTVIRSSDANAFVLPGNHVFVLTGLFKYVRDEDELASIMGHEMAHNLARHAGERLSDTILLSILHRLSLFIDPSGTLLTFLSLRVHCYGHYPTVVNMRWRLIGLV